MKVTLRELKQLIKEAIEEQTPRDTVKASRENIQNLGRIKNLKSIKGRQLTNEEQKELQGLESRVENYKLSGEQGQKDFEDRDRSERMGKFDAAVKKEWDKTPEGLAAATARAAGNAEQARIDAEQEQRQRYWDSWDREHAKSKNTPAQPPKKKKKRVYDWQGRDVTGRRDGSYMFEMIREAILEENKKSNRR